MKGLLIKDLYTMRNYIKSLLIIVAIIVATSLGMDFSPISSSFMLTVYLLISSISLFSFDEVCNWNRYAVSLPVSRRTIVAARYIFFLLMLLAVSLLGFALTTVLALVRGATSWMLEAGYGLLVSALFMLLNVSFSYPIAYKFGAEKSRYVISAFYAVPVLLLLLFSRMLNINLENLSTASLFPLTLAIAVVILGLYAVSFFVSLKIFSRKDF